MAKIAAMAISLATGFIGGPVMPYGIPQISSLRCIHSSVSQPGRIGSQ